MRLTIDGRGTDPPIPLPRTIPLDVPEGVYAPKLDSFMLARRLALLPLEGRRVLDVGTGSGFLGIVAGARGARVVLADVHPPSVKAAAANAAENGVDAEAREGDLLDVVRPGETFDVVVANPPSLPEVAPSPDEYVRRAVDGGPDGRAALDRILAAAPAVLAPGGILLVGHSGFADPDATLARLRAQGLRVDRECAERPLGRTSGARLDALRARLPEARLPRRRGDEWLQEFWVFEARRA